MVSKQALRQELLTRRKRLTKPEVNDASELIRTKLLRLPNWTAATRAHIYTSNAAWNEIDTKELIRELRQRYPSVTIESSQVSARAPLPVGLYDIILVPVLGFDRENYRLGLGGGWYDRFLAVQSRAHKIGLAYSWSELIELPHELHDVPLDRIITEL